MAIATASAPSLAAMMKRAFGPLPAQEGAFWTAPNLYVSLETTQAAPRRPACANAPGLAHLCIQSPDAARLWETLSLEGGLVFTAPLTGLGGPFRYAYGYTAEGLMVELEETPGAPPDGPNAWIAHVAFVTQDLQRLSRFYAALTDRPVTEGQLLKASRRADRITGLEGVAMTPAWVQGLNVSLEFWRFDAPAFPGDTKSQGAGYAGLCLQTDDLPLDEAKAVALGATLEAPPEPWAGGLISRLRDPDGNALALLALPTAHPCCLERLPHRDVLRRHAHALEALS